MIWNMEPQPRSNGSNTLLFNATQVASHRANYSSSHIRHSFSAAAEPGAWNTPEHSRAD